MKSNTKPDWSIVSDLNDKIKNLWNQWESLKLTNNVLLRTCCVDNKEGDQIIIAETHCSSILKELHEGNSRTFSLLLNY